MSTEDTDLYAENLQPTDRGILFWLRDTAPLGGEE